jgi:hypothetical protein
MISLKKERRHRKAVELICEKLQITDAELDAFISKDKTQEVTNPPELTAKEVAELIVNCKTVEDLKKYETDKRQVVKAAYSKKLKELE